MVKLDYNQARKVHKLIREECCNCVDGNCILLDDSCVQLIKQISICRDNDKERGLTKSIVSP